ncbi:ABC transporter substrate-binding protein [Facklamia sp. DSM 111018]|uniref:ABC transporter substrate-binding protein n=1 Tax=Facklamia lactis TaxID=2749967 RepID=A0ABS0LNJ4_9LACT|nr:ABC transporter substrate-binding protein [Facklamia lactis]MBG9979585.1 ABC transporter substrate-binding protein [Facklamia lactis]MBG9985735.1 ABC transporter substrate-binding protein [Facklamia lactis]
MRKVLTKVLAGILGLSTLAGGLGVQTVAAEEKVTVNYWHVNADTQGGQTVTELVKKFNESQDTIEVVATYNPDMYKGLMQNMQAAVAGDNTPDVVQIGWQFVDYFSENFDYVEPQTIIDQFDSENADYLEKTFLPNVLELAKNKEDSLVGLPYSVSNPVLYLNRDLLREAGLDENGPKTWEEVKEFAATIKDKTGKYGFYLQQPADNWGTQGLLESNGAKFIEDGKAAFASQEGIDAYQLWADMVLKDETAVNLPWDQGVQSFIQGEIAMVYTTIAQRTNIQSNAKFDVATTTSPAFEGKESQIPAGGAMLVMTAQDEKVQEATWEFLKFLYENENVLAWTEGTGYVPSTSSVMDSEEMMKFLEENPMMEAAINQMDKVNKWASFPGDAGLEAEQLLLDMRDSILTGSEEPADALPRVQEEINNLLQ